MEQGYTPRELHFDSEGRNKLTSGIAKISKAVKSTLGPRGQTVLIESRTHTHGITVTKDGVTVAKSIDLLDPVENLAVKMMKEAADRTATSAGDGTTTAIVLTEALVDAGEKHLDKSVNPTVVIREINKHTSHVIKKLEKQSKKLSKKRLLDVATISSNNDREIGKIIYDTYNKVGQDGLVTVENSQSHNTYSEVTKGIRVERGYTLKPIISNGDKLLIIGNCHNNVVNTLAANVVRNGLKICNIMPPQFGYKQHELMSDIALAVGAKYFSEKTGDDLSLISTEDLGHAAKVIVGRDNTIIIRDDKEVAEIPQRVEELWEQHKNTKIKSEKDFILQRIASLSGGIGVIYVGGNSDVEQKEKFDRVDDAVCAVRSALEEGILEGGGVPLLKLSRDLNSEVDNEEERVAIQILKDALSVPCKQILRNAGEDEDAVVEQMLKNQYGYDVKHQVYGDMYKMGVIDPLKVTKNALINAVSVATTILSTNAIVTLARTYDSK